MLQALAHTRLHSVANKGAFLYHKSLLHVLGDNQRVPHPLESAAVDQLHERQLVLYPKQRALQLLQCGAVLLLLQLEGILRSAWSGQCKAATHLVSCKQA